MESPRLRCPVNPSDGKLSHSAARDYSAPLQAQFRHHVAEPQVVARDELAEFLGGKERRGEADRLAGGPERRGLARAPPPVPWPGRRSSLAVSLPNFSAGRNAGVKPSALPAAANAGDSTVRRTASSRRAITGRGAPFGVATPRHMSSAPA